MNDKDKKTTLLKMADVVAGTQNWIDEHTDPDTGELIATDDEMALYFGAPDIAEAKIISLARLRVVRTRNIRLIDEEIQDTENEMNRLTASHRQRIEELNELKATQNRQINWFKHLVSQYLIVSETMKFNYGVTSGYLKESASIVIEDQYVDNLPDEFKRIQVRPMKDELKKAIKSGEIDIDDLEGVTFTKTTSFIWK